MNDYSQTMTISAAIRRRVLEHVLLNNGGYISQACSSAELLATLYHDILHLGDVDHLVPEPFISVPKQGNHFAGAGARFNGAEDPDYDRFIFSPVHYSLVLYATLIEMGRLAPDSLELFNVDGQTLEMIGAEHSPGIELTAGSLAQALSQACGIAIGRKHLSESGRVVVMMSDGELQEGQTWEAFASASYHRLDNLLIFIDVNKQQCDGDMSKVFEIANPRDRIESFGIKVVEVDAHDPQSIVSASEVEHSDQPLVVLCHSDPCRDISLLEERKAINKLHHVRFVDEKEHQAYTDVYYKLCEQAGVKPKSITIKTTSLASSKEDFIQRPHRENLVKFAKKHPEIFVLSADLTSSCEADYFRETYPERFYSLGMAEQNMMSVAGGLARKGFIPYVHTFAVFCTRRPYDQVAMSIAYPNLPVRIIGFLPGVSTPGGVTHQAIDDIALMKALPNMTVVECGDATEVESVLDAIHNVDGPVYVRMLRGAVPRIFDRKQTFNLHQPRRLDSFANEEFDLLLLSSGMATKEALRATPFLMEQGVKIAHLHISTHKLPNKDFADPLTLDLIKSSRYGVITMENHSLVGGLASSVAETIAVHGLHKKLRAIGLADSFAHGASMPYLLRYYDMDAWSLIKRVEKMLDREFEIRLSDLDAAHTALLNVKEKAENL